MSVVFKHYGSEKNKWRSKIFNCLYIFLILTMKKNYRHTTGSLLPESIWFNSLGYICVLYGSQKNYRWDNILFYNLKITEDFCFCGIIMGTACRTHHNHNDLVITWSWFGKLQRLSQGWNQVCWQLTSWKGVKTSTEAVSHNVVNKKKYEVFC